MVVSSNNAAVVHNLAYSHHRVDSNKLLDVTRLVSLRRSVRVNPRCEASLDPNHDLSLVKSSSISALEALKTSAGDSKFIFSFLIIILVLVIDEI